MKFGWIRGSGIRISTRVSCRVAIMLLSPQLFTILLRYCMGIAWLKDSGHTFNAAGPFHWVCTGPKFSPIVLDEKGWSNNHWNTAQVPIRDATEQMWTNRRLRWRTCWLIYFNLAHAMNIRFYCYLNKLSDMVSDWLIFNNIEFECRTDTVHVQFSVPEL